MSAPASFDDVKALLIDRVKRLELCPAYQQLVMAATWQDLITAAEDVIVWSYQSDVVDDGILDAFPQDTLNSNNIYTSGTVTLANPATAVYLLGYMTLNVEINDDLPHYFFVMGNANINVTLSGNGYAEITGYNLAIATSTLSDQSSLKIDIRHTVSANITSATDESVVHATTRGNSQLQYAGSASNFSHFRAFNYSTINYEISDDAENDSRAYDSAIIQTIQS